MNAIIDMIDGKFPEPRAVSAVFPYAFATPVSATSASRDISRS